MAKWKIVAYPDEENRSAGKKEIVIEANGRYEAMDIGYKLFPEYHELGAYEVKEWYNEIL